MATAPVYSSALIEALRNASSAPRGSPSGVMLLPNGANIGSSINFVPRARTGLTNPTELTLGSYSPSSISGTGTGRDSGNTDRRTDDRVVLPDIDDDEDVVDEIVDDTNDDAEEDVADEVMDEPANEQPATDERSQDMEEVGGSDDSSPVRDTINDLVGIRDVYIPTGTNSEPEPEPEYDEIPQGEIDVGPPGNTANARGPIRDYIPRSVGDPLDEWEWIEPDIPEIPLPEIPAAGVGSIDRELLDFLLLNGGLEDFYDTFGQ